MESLTIPSRACCAATVCVWKKQSQLATARGLCTMEGISKNSYELFRNIKNYYKFYRIPMALLRALKPWLIIRRDPGVLHGNFQQFAPVSISQQGTHGTKRLHSSPTREHRPGNCKELLRISGNHS